MFKLSTSSIKQTLVSVGLIIGFVAPSFAQNYCNQRTYGAGNAPLCGTWTSYAMGPGEYRNVPTTSGVYYEVTHSGAFAGDYLDDANPICFRGTGQPSGMVLNATAATTTIGTQQQGIPGDGWYGWNGGPAGTGSTTINYRIYTPPTPSAPSRNISSGCLGATVTLTSNGTYVGSNYVWQATPAGNGLCCSTTASNDNNVTAQPTSTGTFSYRTQTNNGGCYSAWSGYQTFTVYADPTISSFTADQSACYGQGATFTAGLSGGVGTVTYEFQTQFNGGGFSTVQSGTGSSYSFPATAAAGTWQVRVRVTTSGTACDWSAYTTRTFTVYADPTVTQTTSWIQQCTGGNISLTATYGGGYGTPSYTWQYRDWSGSTWTNAGTSSSLTVSAASAFDRAYRVLYNMSGTNCNQAVSAERRVTVYDQPSVTQSFETITSQICIGGTSITLSVNSASSAPGTAQYQWQSSTSSGGTYTDISGATSSTYTVPNTPASNLYYRVRYTTTGTNCGFGYSSWRRVIVNADPTVSLSGATTVCTGADVTITGTGSNGTGTPTYTFQYFNGSWTTVQTGASSNFTFASGTYGLGTHQFRVLYTTSGSGCGTATSNTVNVVVVADPTVSFNTSTIEKCTGGSETLSASMVNGTGTPSYQWQYRDNGNPTWTNLGTASTQSVSTTTAFDRFYRVIISTTGAGCNTATSGQKQIIVYDQPTTSITGSDIDVCTGAVITFSATGQSGGTGTAQYQWQSSTTSATTGFSDISGATSSSYTVPTGSVTGNIWYRVGYSTSGTNCGTGYSTGRRVRVYSQPTVSVDGSDVDICAGGSVTYNGTGGSGSGTGSYQWQSGPSATGPWSNIGGETNSSITYTLAPGNTVYLRIAYTTSSTGCGTVYSAARRVSSYFDPSVTISGSNTTVCSGASVTFTATGNLGTGSGSYQWQQSSSSTGPFTSISGQTSTSYSAPTGTVGTTYYRVTYSTPGDGCDVATSLVRSVTVVPDPTVSISGTDVIVCTGTGASYTITGNNGTGGATIVWESGPTTTGPWSVISGATTATYNAPTSSVGVTYYRATYSTSGSGCDPAVSAVRRVEVVADPTAPTTATFTPNQATVCTGITLTLTGPASGGDSGLGCEIHYRYSTSSGSGGSWVYTGTTIPSFTSATVSGSTNIIQAARINCQTGCDASGYATVASWSVVPQPEAPTLAIGNPNVSSVCIGTTLTLSGVASGGEIGDGCSIQYRYSTDGGSTWSTPSTSVPSFTSVGSSDQIIQARRASCTSSCNDSPWNTLVTWSMIPDNTITLTSAPGTDGQTICVLHDFTDITYGTSTATGATITGLPSGISGSWSSNEVLITGSPSVTGTFNYTVSLTGGCNGGSASGSISVISPINTGYLTWTGAQDINWDNSNNWDCLIIPTLSDDVIIPNGMPFSPTVLGVTPTEAKCNTIELQGSVVLTIQESLGAWLEVGN